MKSKCRGIVIAVSLLAGSTSAQEVVVGDQKKSQISAIDTAIKRLKRFKACLQGKEPCGKLDFAALGTALLIAYGAMKALQMRLFGYETITKEGKIGGWDPRKKTTFETIDRFDPAKWGYRMFSKPIPRDK